jgi:hypothetical protein
MVQEPDSLEVVEDDVYHPDQSCSDTVNVIGASSMRSLEPIVAGPIGLKTVFYDPRCTPTQRKLCMGMIAYWLLNLSRYESIIIHHLLRIGNSDCSEKFYLSSS